jgi:hypothetical protein
MVGIRNSELRPAIKWLFPFIFAFAGAWEFRGGHSMHGCCMRGRCMRGRSMRGRPVACRASRVARSTRSDLCLLVTISKELVRFCNANFERVSTITRTDFLFSSRISFQ